MYYIYEIQMPEEDYQLLKDIIAKENITLDELCRQGLTYLIGHSQEVRSWKEQMDQMPLDERKRYDQIKTVRVYPVEDGESEEQARDRILQKEHEAYPYSNRLSALPEISQQEFCDHIEDEDFFLVYGNPVIVRADCGIKALAVAFPMYERYMRIIGRGDEIDRIKRDCAEQYEQEKEAEATSE